MARKRNVHLAAEMSDNPEEFDAEAYEHEEAKDVMVAAGVLEPEAPPAPPTPPAGMDMAAFAQLLAQAIQTGTQGAIENTKPVVRETESEQRSAFNPDGITKPRPQLECPTFIGMHQKENPDQRPSAIYDYDPAQCTNDEIRALNALPAGRHLVRLYDGKQEPVVVQVVKDDLGQAVRKVVAFPAECFEKSRRNMIPNVCEIAAMVQASVG